MEQLPAALGRARGRRDWRSKVLAGAFDPARELLPAGRLRPSAENHAKTRDDDHHGHNPMLIIMMMIMAAPVLIPRLRANYS